MASKAIINASPLIFLTRSHPSTVIESFFVDEIWIPEPVAKEIMYRGQQDITAMAIANTDWLIKKGAGSRITNSYPLLLYSHKVHKENEETHDAL